MRNPRVFITGIGIVNAAGLGVAAFWDAVASGRSCIRLITRFDTDGFPVKVAGEICDFRAQDFIPRRFLVKTDRFTHYALAAADMALADAKLDLTAGLNDRVGVWLGNDTGGWDLAERGFLELHRQGAAMVNPWGATAWFPAAPQGFITIRHAITGYSKSFVCDRATGSASLYFAFRAIRAGHNQVVLAGGTEAPLTPLGVLSYHETGELSAGTDPRTAYRPFDRQRDGLVLGEGSTVLVLENGDQARARGAHVYGELLSGSMTFDPEPSQGLAMERAMCRAIRDARLTPRNVDLILAEGCGTPFCDRLEAGAISRVFAAESPHVPVTSPKSIYGHLFGASGATEVACALMSMQTSRLPPTLNLEDPEPEGNLAFVTHPERKLVCHALINARGREGVNVALVIGRARPDGAAEE